MDAGQKKAFHIKVQAVVRTLKEYRSYRTEVEAYDMNQVSQDKKKQAFYDESKEALISVEQKLLEFYQGLVAYISENQEQIEEEEEVQENYNKAKEQIAQIKELFPAAA